jgi:hypothetical protein
MKRPTKRGTKRLQYFLFNKFSMPEWERGRFSGWRAWTFRLSNGIRKSKYIFLSLLFSLFILKRHCREQCYHKHHEGIQNNDNPSGFVPTMLFVPPWWQICYNYRYRYTTDCRPCNCSPEWLSFGQTIFASTTWGEYFKCYSGLCGDHFHTYIRVQCFFSSMPSRSTKLYVYFHLSFTIKQAQKMYVGAIKKNSDTTKRQCIFL